MSAAHRENARLFLETRRSIDKICDEFEEEWRQKKRPPLESYVSRMSGPAQSDLLRALLTVELEYRYRDSEAPSPEEYWNRLPDFVVAITTVFDSTPPPGRRPTVEAAIAAIFEDEPADDPERTLTWLPHTLTLEHPGPPKPELAAPLNVPGYQNLGVVFKGKGGMGVVHLAWQASLRRKVALKMIRSEWAADPEFRARFLREAQTIAGLKHPNIIPIYDQGETDEKQLYYAMEFIEGGDLRDRLAEEPMSPRQAAELLEKLAGAMHEVHLKGVVHLDLKPANILLTADGTPKVADFGLAKRLEGSETVTHGQQLIGTVAYMAPEQALGLKDVDHVADIHALGAILYESLTGQPPFRGATLLETLEQVRHVEPVRPSRLQRKLPRDLETICLKCLEKDPARRYATAQDLADDLRRFLEGKPVLARATPAWERALKWCRRRPALAALQAVGCLALVLLIANVATMVWGLRVDAERAEQELQLELRTEGARQVAMKSLAMVEQALRDRQWREVAPLLKGVEDSLQRDPSLRGHLRDQARELRARLLKGEETQKKYEDFKRLADEAIFHAWGATGLDLPGSLIEARGAAREALALFQMDRDGATKPALDRMHFTTEEQQQIVTGCYVLLVTLADATARCLPGEQPVQQTARADAIRKRAAGLHRGDPLAEDLFLLGNRAYRARQFQQAVTYFQRALDHQPRRSWRSASLQFWANFSIASCSLHLSRPEKAEAHLTACQGLKDDFAWIYILRGLARGQLAAKSRVGAAAERYFADADADFVKAEKLLHKAEKLLRKADPDARYVLLVNRGLVRTDQGRYAAAIADFEQADKLHDQLFHAHWALAFARHRQEKDSLTLSKGAEVGRLIALTPLCRPCPLPVLLAQSALPPRPRPPLYGKALDHLNRAIELMPKLARLHHYRGQLRIERHEPAKAALQDFEEAIRCLPSEALLTSTERRILQDAYFECGRCLYALGDFPKALTAFDAALLKGADLNLIHRLRAGSLMRVRRYKAAVEAFNRYLKSGGSRSPDVLEGLALCAVMRGYHQDAIDYFSEALKLEKSSTARARLHAFRGWVHLQLLEREKEVERAKEIVGMAKRDFEKAIWLDPKNVDAYAGRGNLLAQLGKYREAVADAEEARKSEPPTPRLLYSAARIYAQAAVAPTRNSDLYKKEAVNLIQDALHLLPFTQERLDFWRTVIQPDCRPGRALSAILRHPGFDRLAGQYQAKPK